MPVRVRELYRLLWTLIHKPKKKTAAKAPKAKKPETAAQKAARSANGKKAAAAKKAKKKTAPAPRSGHVARPKKAASPRPATHAA